MKKLQWTRKTVSHKTSPFTWMPGRAAHWLMAGTAMAGAAMLACCFFVPRKKRELRIKVGRTQGGLAIHPETEAA